MNLESKGRKNTITVLLSTYNGEKYLREQLDSVLCQEDVNITLLIRDDGSTDKTIEIIKEYVSKYNNILFVQGDNCGAAMSFWQLIIDSPQSDYYAFCDQDDIWDRDKLKVAIDNLKRYDAHTPGMYYSTARLVAADGKTEIKRKISDYEKKVPTFAQLVMENTAAGCTMVWNAKLNSIAKNIKVSNMRMHDHFLFLICKYYNGNICLDNTPHINYRQHGENVIGGQKTLKRNILSVKRYLKEDSGLSEQAIQLLGLPDNNKICSKNMEFLEQLKDYRHQSLSKRLLIYFEVKQIGLLKNLCIMGIIILKRF